MSPTELKDLYLKKNPRGTFFTSPSMIRRGDTMPNFTVERIYPGGIPYLALHRKDREASVYFRVSDMRYSTVRPIDSDVDNNTWDYFLSNRRNQA